METGDYASANAELINSAEFLILWWRILSISQPCEKHQQRYVNKAALSENCKIIRDQLWLPSLVLLLTVL